MVRFRIDMTQTWNKGNRKRPLGGPSGALLLFLSKIINEQTLADHDFLSVDDVKSLLQFVDSLTLNVVYGSLAFGECG